jgi:hypothetical protein
MSTQPTQPDKVDEVVRDWYERQAMSGARVEAIRRAVAGTPVQGRRWMTRAMAACVALVLVAGMFVLVDRRDAMAASRTLAAEVVRLQGANMVAAVGPVPELAGMTRLGFTPVVPERCKKEGYKLVGARYREVAGAEAVEVRVIDDDGKPQTLCEMSGRRVADVQLKLEGVPVSVWHEAGLVMVMTGD